MDKPTDGRPVTVTGASATISKKERPVGLGQLRAALRCVPVDSSRAETAKGSSHGAVDELSLYP